MISINKFNLILILNIGLLSPFIYCTTATAGDKDEALNVSSEGCSMASGGGRPLTTTAALDIPGAGHRVANTEDPLPMAHSAPAVLLGGPGEWAETGDDDLPARSVADDGWEKPKRTFRRTPEGFSPEDLEFAQRMRQMQTRVGQAHTPAEALSYEEQMKVLMQELPGTPTRRRQQQKRMKTLLALAQDAGFPDRVLRDSEEVMLAEAVVGHHQGLPLQNTGLLFDAGHTAVLPPELVDRILEMAGLDAAARFSLTHCAAYERYGFLTGLMGRKRPPVLMGYHLAVARRMFLHGGPATYLNMRGLWPNPADTRAYLRRVQGWNAASGARVVRLDLSLCNQNERALTRPIVVTRAPLLAQPSVLSLMTGVRDFILDDVVFDPRTDPDLGHRFSVDRLMRALAWRNIRCLSLRRTGITDADLDFIVGCLLGQHHLSLDLKSNRLTHLSNEAIAFFASHVTTLGLSNNAISNIGDLIGALHQGTALHTLYLRSTGMRGLRLYYMLLEALQGRSSLTAVDLRDNPGLGLDFGFVMQVVAYNRNVREMRIGSLGAGMMPRPGPRVPPMPTDDQDLRQPMKGTQLHALYFGGAVGPADLTALTNFFAGRSRLNHLAFQGGVDAALLPGLLPIASLQTLALHEWTGNEAASTALGRALWVNPTVHTFDVRGANLSVEMLTQIIVGIGVGQQFVHDACAHKKCGDGACLHELWQHRYPSLYRRLRKQGNAKKGAPVEQAFKKLTVMVHPGYDAAAQEALRGVLPPDVRLEMRPHQDPLEG